MPAKFPIIKCPKCRRRRATKSLTGKYEICKVCHQDNERSEATIHPLFRMFRRLAGSGKAKFSDKVAVAAVCREILFFLGWDDDGYRALGPRAVGKVIAEMVVRIDHIRLDKLEGRENLVKCQLMAALMNCLTTLEELDRQEDMNSKLHSKILADLPLEEYRDAMLPLAAKLVHDNPELAVRALYDAGYEVKLWRRSHKRGPKRKPISKPPDPTGISQ